MATGIGGVATQIDLDSNTCPLHREGTTKFIAPLSHMMKGFRNFNPVVKKKLAVHSDLPTWACKNGYSGSTHHNDKQRATSS